MGRGITHTNKKIKPFSPKLKDVLFMLEKGCWAGSKATPDWVKEVEGRIGESISPHTPDFVIHLIIPAMWEEISMTHDKISEFEIKNALEEYMGLNIEEIEEVPDEI
jgi:hypothetical protein